MVETSVYTSDQLLNAPEVTVCSSVTENLKTVDNEHKRLPFDIFFNKTCNGTTAEGVIDCINTARVPRTALIDHVDYKGN